MIARFSLELVCGLSLMWMLMPRSQITSGFFRIQMLLALGLSVLSAVAVGTATKGSAATISSLIPPAAVCGATALAAFLGSVMWTLNRRNAGTVFIFVTAAASMASLLLVTLQNMPAEMQHVWLKLASELSTASLLGASVAGMLLGHWYLTAPTMSILPLGRVNMYYGVAAVVRGALSAVGLCLAWETASGGLHGVWLSLRWGAGIFGPMVVVLMVWRILKYRNTQAATGVLFVGVILSFIGETAALLLSSEIAVPL